MDHHLQFIVQFANSISETFRQFAHVCQQHMESAKKGRDRPQSKDKTVEEDNEEQLDQRLQKSWAKGKKPLNAFVIFLNEMREKILRDHPTLQLHKVTSLAAIRWKKLSDDDRAPYQKKYEQACKQYKQQETINNQGNPNASENRKGELAQAHREKVESKEDNMRQEEEEGNEGESKPQQPSGSVQPSQNLQTYLMNSEGKEQGSMNQQQKNELISKFLHSSVSKILESNQPKQAEGKTDGTASKIQGQNYSAETQGIKEATSTTPKKETSITKETKAEEGENGKEAEKNTNEKKQKKQDVIVIEPTLQ